MYFGRHKIVYRGFTYTDVFNLVQSGQAEALGHGPGVSGAFNWIDNSPGVHGERPQEHERLCLINRIRPAIEADLASNASQKLVMDQYNHYR